MMWSVLDQSPASAGSSQDAAIRVGSAAQVAEKLHALAHRLELEEIVINTWTFDPQARRHSYSLLAGVFGLSPVAKT